MKSDRQRLSGGIALHRMKMTVDRGGGFYTRAMTLYNPKLAILHDQEGDRKSIRWRLVNGRRAEED